LILTDFRAFYCGAHGQLSGADPYREEPLRACQLATKGIADSPTGMAMPAPLPGYDFALLAPFASLPFPPAAIAWIGILSLALASSVVSLRRLTKLPLTAIWAALMACDGITSILLGQLVPLSVAGLCLLARGCRTNNPLLTFAGVGLAMMEPHLGFGAVLAVLLFGSNTTRISVAGATCLLAGLSITTLGIWGNREFFSVVLPAHALSEVAYVQQYSLTHLLHLLGVSDKNAVTVGSLQYGAMLILGLALARSIAQSTGDRAFLALIPPAAAVLGGPFLHIWQIAAAMPAALLAYATFPNLRSLTRWAIYGLAIPWGAIAFSGAMLPAEVVGIIILAPRLLGLRKRAALFVATVPIATTALAMFTLASNLKPHVPSEAFNGNSLAEDAWKAVVETALTDHPLMYLAFRLPTWAALVTLLVVLIRSARKSIQEDSSPTGSDVVIGRREQFARPHA
ncbi:MAG TPA: glycosyltransferase 87 family protein, partial [Candidatus Baltobacteraceae bacterium]|nr:glycosyltransferase 87 family protein [Candidatus Baltobacteraceae bacterium]